MNATHPSAQAGEPAQILSLCPIGPGELARVAHIKVAPDQIKFSGTVQQAFDLAEPDVDFHAICLDGHPVGFFKVDHDYAATHVFARPNEPGIRAFMIGFEFQDRGIATAAIRLLARYLPDQYPEIRSIVLTVNMANRAATRVYRNAGFVDTGEIHEGGLAGPQHVMRMIMRD